MKKTVLLVDDYKDSRMILRKMIELSGHCVIEAADGLEALKAIAKEHFDLILMDISMPVMDGITAVKVIKNNRPTAKIPIVVITAHSPKYCDEVIEAGALEVISKPIYFETLKPVLAKYL